MEDWKELFKKQTITVGLMRTMFRDDTEQQKVLMRSDAVTICISAITQTYERLIEKTGSDVIKKELEEFMRDDISALGM